MVQALRECTLEASEAYSPLIPVHDTTNYDAVTSTLPSLRDVTGEGENLRYWVVTEKSQWKGQHRIIDEISEVLLCLHEAFASASWSGEETIDPQFMKEKFAFRDPEKSVEDRRDVLLFRQLVLPSPTQVVPKFGWVSRVNHTNGNHVHSLFRGDDVKYPFPNELFWKEGDEGERGPSMDGVPEWREPTVAQEMARNTRAQEFYDPRHLRNVDSSKMADAPVGPIPSFCQGEHYGNSLHFVDDDFISLDT